MVLMARNVCFCEEMKRSVERLQLDRKIVLVAEYPLIFSAVTRDKRSSLYSRV
jgi:hypothetical protein